MTHVSNTTTLFSAPEVSSITGYIVEVITFDNESETICVEASCSDEAMDIAASMFDNVDYVMVQGVI